MEIDINKICIKCMKMVKEGTVCPTCGRDLNTPFVQGHCLRPYTILNGKYLIGDVIGEGGFGITYVGLDLNLQSKIAIKEFFPSGQVSRDNTMTSTITMFANSNQQVVKKWRDSFVKEAQALSKCSNLPGIVGVRDFFYENDTAYIVMEFVEGEDLKAYVKKRGGILPPAELFRMIEPAILSLQKAHEVGVIHRDISPDNIRIDKTGQVKLIDFGAARSFDNEDEKSKSIFLKPGYAPPEQYFTKGNQGPWSDVYAVAATLYKCLTGKTPAESMERLRMDSLKSPMEMGVQISPATNAVIMKALEVYEDKRYRSMQEFHDALYGSLGNGTQIKEQAASGIEDDIPDNAENTENASGGSFSDLLKKNPLFVVFGAAIVLLIVIMLVMAGGDKKKAAKEKPEPDYGSTIYEDLSHGRCYVIGYIKRDDAERKCEASGGTLISIDTVDEFNSLKKSLKELNDTKENLKNVVFWIGADHVTNESQSITANNLMLYYDAASDQIKWVNRTVVDPMEDRSESIKIGYIFEASLSE